MANLRKFTLGYNEKKDRWDIENALPVILLYFCQ